MKIPSPVLADKEKLRGVFVGHSPKSVTKRRAAVVTWNVQNWFCMPVQLCLQQVYSLGVEDTG